MLVEPERHFNELDLYAAQIPFSRGSDILDCCGTFIHGFRVANTFSRAAVSLLLILPGNQTHSSDICKVRGRAEKSDPGPVDRGVNETSQANRNRFDQSW